MPLVRIYLPISLPPGDPNPSHHLTFTSTPPAGSHTVSLTTWGELVEPDPFIDGSPPLTPITSLSDLSDADLYVWDLDDDDGDFGPQHAPPPYVDDHALPDPFLTLFPPSPSPAPLLVATASIEPVVVASMSDADHRPRSPSPTVSDCSAFYGAAAPFPLPGPLRLPFPYYDIPCPANNPLVWAFHHTLNGNILRTYELTVRQQPVQARMCGAGEKSDRRPVDPTPIIQLKVIDRDGDDVTSVRPSTRDGPADQRMSGLRRPDNLETGMTFMQNPYYFLFACLVGAEDDNDQVEELHVIDDGKTRFLTGTPVSSLYHLKDLDGSDAAFFVFPDLGVRKEGKYKFKMTLFEMVEGVVFYCATMYTGPFSVYSAKKFPGMQRATDLSKSFADQGLKIRVRKDPRRRAAKMTRRRASGESDDEDYGHLPKRIRSSHAPDTPTRLDSAPTSSSAPPAQYMQHAHSSSQGYRFQPAPALTPAPHQQYQDHAGYPVGTTGQGMRPPPIPSYDAHRRRSSAGYSPQAMAPQQYASAAGPADNRYAEPRHAPASAPLGSAPLHHPGMTRGPQGRHAPRSEGPAYGGQASHVPWPQDRHSPAGYDSHTGRYEQYHQLQQQYQQHDQHAPQHNPPHSAGSHGSHASHGSALPSARAFPSSYRSMESTSPRMSHDQIMHEQQHHQHQQQQHHHQHEQRLAQQYRASSSASSTRTGGTPSLTLTPMSRTASPHHIGHIMDSTQMSGGGSSSAHVSRSASSGSPGSVGGSASGSRRNRMGVDHLVD